MSYWKFRAAQRAAARDRLYRERTLRHARREAGCIGSLILMAVRVPLGLALVAVGLVLRMATYRPTGFRRKPSRLVRAGTRLLTR